MKNMSELEEKKETADFQLEQLKKEYVEICKKRASGASNFEEEYKNYKERVYSLLSMYASWYDVDKVEYKINEVKKLLD